MIKDDSIQKVHCETHDDIVVRRLVVDAETVEYIQVKSNEPDKLWSVADMCAIGSVRCGILATRSATTSASWSATAGSAESSAQAKVCSRS